MTKRAVFWTVNRLLFWIFAFTVQIYPNGFGLDRSASTPVGEKKENSKKFPPLMKKKVNKKSVSLFPPLMLESSNII
jgi:hypothetical protein